MTKKITVTLDDCAYDHFTEVSYSLDLPNKRTSQSDVISHCLGECKAFEDIMDDQITNWLVTNHPEKYKQWLKDNNIQQYSWETGKPIPCKEEEAAQPAQ